MPETKTETKMIEPQNGVIECDYCAYCPRENDAKSDAKVGDVCARCLKNKEEYGYRIREDARYVLNKMTVLGPLHPVVATGNPLLDAAAILKVDGWLSGNWVCENGKKCLAGGVRAAAGMLPDPEMEGHTFAQKYVNTKRYEQARKRAERAIFFLAQHIEKITKVPADERKANLDNYEPDGVLDVVTSYNDLVLKEEDGRRKALRVLRDAAKNYNPRLRLPGM